MASKILLGQVAQPVVDGLAHLSLHVVAIGREARAQEERQIDLGPGSDTGLGCLGVMLGTETPPGP